MMGIVRVVLASEVHRPRPWLAAAAAHAVFTALGVSVPAAPAAAPRTAPPVAAPPAASPAPATPQSIVAVPAPIVTPAPPGATPPATAKSAASPVHPLRASAPAFGATLEVEVRDLPREAADAAIQAVATEVGEVERLTDPDRLDGELATLNAAAGKGPRPVDARLFAALTRALNFCFWSDGKEGPLGRDLNRLWGRGAAAPPAAKPTPDQVNAAVAAASCKRLQLDGRKQTATLAAGSALDLADFRIGMAIDRAIEVLRQHGSANALVLIGDVRRGIGLGRDGRGWLVDLPAISGLTGPLGRIFLRDRSLAIAGPEAAPPQEGHQPPIYVNQSTGLPAGEGILATLALTELAIDAQALAATMTITGAQEGEMLTGSVRPRPAILWLMGSGTGIPVMVPYRWDEVPRR